MSRAALEAEIAQFIESALDEVENKIRERFEGTFDAYAPIDSALGVTNGTHLTLRQNYANVLAACIRWPIWLKND